MTLRETSTQVEPADFKPVAGHSPFERLPTELVHRILADVYANAMNPAEMDRVIQSVSRAVNEHIGNFPLMQLEAIRRGGVVLTMAHSVLKHLLANKQDLSPGTISIWRSLCATPWMLARSGRQVLVDEVSRLPPYVSRGLAVRLLAASDRHPEILDPGQREKMIHLAMSDTRSPRLGMHPVVLGLDRVVRDMNGFHEALVQRIETAPLDAVAAAAKEISPLLQNLTPDHQDRLVQQFHGPTLTVGAAEELFSNLDKFHPQQRAALVQYALQPHPGPHLNVLPLLAPFIEQIDVRGKAELIDALLSQAHGGSYGCAVALGWTTEHMSPIQQLSLMALHRSAATRVDIKFATGLALFDKDDPGADFGPLLALMRSTSVQPIQRARAARILARLVPHLSTRHQLAVVQTALESQTDEDRSLAVQGLAPALGAMHVDARDQLMNIATCTATHSPRRDAMAAIFHEVGHLDGDTFDRFNRNSIYLSVADRVHVMSSMASSIHAAFDPSRAVAAKNDQMFMKPCTALERAAAAWRLQPAPSRP